MNIKKADLQTIQRNSNTAKKFEDEFDDKSSYIYLILLKLKAETDRMTSHFFFVFTSNKRLSIFQFIMKILESSSNKIRYLN